MGMLDYFVLLILVMVTITVSGMNYISNKKAISILSNTNKEQAKSIIFEYCYSGAVLELNGKPWHVACFPVSTE